MKWKFTRQILIMSKYALLGMIAQALLSTMIFAKDGYAQKSIEEVYVSLQLEDASLKQVFNAIEAKTEFTFFYKNVSLKGEKGYDVSFENESLGNVLRTLAKESGLTFKRVNQNISVNRTAQEVSPAMMVQDNAPVQVRISGVVNDDAGEPLPGVSIIIKGTSTGTTTDIDGNYSLSANQGDVLQFSYIGFITQEVTVGSQTQLNIKLEPDLEQLEEVVVVGYGTQVKRDVTGSISTIKSESLTEVKSQSLDVALQGRATGVQVSQSTGVPGAPVRVMVRGTSSISSGTEPLWVIDGIPVSNSVSGIGGGRGGIPQNPLSTINPNDIESIEVLKDAAATAIYGSRGTNGVIIVTTKSGKRGTGELNVDFSMGVTDLTRQPEDMGYADGSLWLSSVDQALANSGRGELDPTANLGVVNPGVDTDDPNIALTRDQLGNTNWFDEILQTGSYQEFNLSTAKGFDQGSIYLSANYRNDEGVMKHNNFERMTVRSNLEYNPVKGLTTGLKLTLAYTKNERVRSSGGGAPGGNDQVGKGGFGEANRGALPIFPVRNSDGTFWNPKSGRNLAASILPENQIDHLTTYRALGGVYLDYALPFLDGLSVRTEASVDLFQTHNIYWASALIRPNSSAYAFDNNNTSRNINYNIFATYNKEFGDHSLNLVAGSESQIFSSQGANLAGQDLRGTAQQVGAPGDILVASGGFGGERYIRGYFGRANYKFKDRYLLGLSFRRDGSSVFAEEDRYVNYPAISAGWILSEENFMSGLDFVSLFKVRGSFGVTGNQSISTSATQTTFLDWPAYGNTTNALAISNLGARDLTWETTESFDVGIDYGFFNDRVSGSVGFFRQDVTDLLFRAPVPVSAGLNRAGNSIWTNLGDLRNEGFEFSITSVNVDKGDFRWTTNFNITTNRNKILSFNPDLDQNRSGVISGLTNNIAGNILGAFFLAEHAGVDPETGVDMIYDIDNRAMIAQEDASGNPVLDANGNPIMINNPDYNQRVVDAEGNFVLIPAHRNNVNGNRRLLDKSGLPKFFGGLTNTLSYKGLEFLFTLTFQGGNYIYDSNEEAATFVGTGGNMLLERAVTNAWQQPGDIAEYPELRWNRRYDVRADGELDRGEGSDPSRHRQRFDRTNSTRFLHKGDFMRLRTIQIAYTFPKQIAEKLYMKNLRVYVGANNLLTFTGYEGWDPEQLNFNGNTQVRNLQQGVVSAQIPQLKTFYTGINVSF